MKDKDKKKLKKMLSNYIKEHSVTNKNLVVENSVLKQVIHNNFYRHAFTDYIKKY